MDWPGSSPCLGTCPVCGSACYNSPSGVVCLNGHGVVEPIPDNSAQLALSTCPFCGAMPIPGLSGVTGSEVVQYRCGTVVAPPSQVGRGDTCRLVCTRFVGGKWEAIPRSDPDHPLNRK